MANDTYSVHCAGNLMPSFFGDPTIIVAGISLKMSQIGECFTLYRKDGKPQLLRGKVTVDTAKVPPDVVSPWELKHTMEEAYGLALNQYRDYLEHTYPQAKDLDLFRAPYHLVAVDKGHIARLWMRNLHHEHIETIHNSTACDSLKSFLGEVRHFPVIKVEQQD
jgi:hypothetical protein